MVKSAIMAQFLCRVLKHCAKIASGTDAVAKLPRGSFIANNRQSGGKLAGRF
jgi:hypothetical protein